MRRRVSSQLKWFERIFFFANLSGCTIALKGEFARPKSRTALGDVGVKVAVRTNMTKLRTTFPPLLWDTTQSQFWYLKWETTFIKKGKRKRKWRGKVNAKKNILPQFTAAQRQKILQNTAVHTQAAICFSVHTHAAICFCRCTYARCLRHSVLHTLCRKHALFFFFFCWSNFIIFFKGDFLVLVEYCRFGNLRSYLRDHRDSFVNLFESFDNCNPIRKRRQVVGDLLQSM